MGAIQSRAIPDFVYVLLHVDQGDADYVRVDLFVYNTDNALKFRMFMRDRDDKRAGAEPLISCAYWPAQNEVLPATSPEPK